MGFRPGQPMAGTQIDVAFIGSCTNGRLSDLREAARVVAGHRVARHVRALVVPGSQAVAAAAEREGLDEVFRDGRLRMARRRLLDVPGDESRPARRPRDLRLVVEPQFQGPAGQPDRPHAADEPGDGGGRRDRRRGRGRARRWPSRCRGATCRFTHHARRRARALVAARRRHRHRPHHPGAVSQGDHVRGPRGAPLRGRPREAAGARRGASVRRSRRAAARGSCSSTRTSAAARRASTRRRRICAPGHPRGRRRVVRGDLLRQLADDRPAVRHGVAATTSSS